MRVPHPLALAILMALAGCGDSEPPPAAGGSAAAGGMDAGGAGAAAAAPAAVAVAAVAVTEFMAGADLSDPATAALDRYLSLTLAGADTLEEVAAALDSVLGCDMGRDMYQPAELLAGYQVTGRSMRADTAVIRARVTTVAEVAAMPDELRMQATQRVRRNEWEWDVVRGADGRWKVCNGPLFVFPARDDGIEWRTPGASATGARMLADSLRGAGGG